MNINCDKEGCGGTMVWSNYCGCYVCDRCQQHAHGSEKTGLISQHLATCYCGWNAHASDPEARHQEEWGW